VPDRAEAWREILCVIEERTVGNDNTIVWAGRRLQLPESRLRPHFVKARVHVHEYPDNSVSVFLGPHRLASYDGHGALLSSPTASSLAACSTASRDGLHSAARVDRPAPRPPLTGLRSLPHHQRRSGRRNGLPFPPMKATDHELQKHDKFTRYQHPSVQRRLRSWTLSAEHFGVMSNIYSEKKRKA
jgi:hypothetical protein